MDISPINGTTTAQTAQSTQAAAETAPISADFETFLTMLTAQLENQDPLNPVDSSDYAVQLATFSSVEQQVLTNDLLQSLTASLGGEGLGTYAAWVGMEVRAQAPLELSGRPLTLSPTIAPGADRADIVILDANGDQVARLPVLTGQENFVWDGTDGDGTALPNGTYSFRTESFSEDTQLGVATGDVYAEVVEAQSVNGVATLILSGGHRVDASTVTAIRPPGQPDEI